MLSAQNMLLWILQLQPKSGQSKIKIMSNLYKVSMYLSIITACDHPVGETLSNAAIKCYFLFSNCIVSNCKLSLVVECDSSTEATINFILCSSLLESPLQPAKILFVYLCVLSYANSLSAILAAIIS